MDKEGPYDGTVSTALEYYIADWNIAALAKELGKTEDHTYFLDRSLGYKNYFDAETGMLRPKRANGKWFAPF
ncbi:glycoside hydrolase domain-containing protein, partial [Okeania hirsuta]|uniref:glycoside hydrolase domain-containing protein n=1 Tax=Okeania hirsuta TaxID=1458930 RepID=UPI0019607609